MPADLPSSLTISRDAVHCSSFSADRDVRTGFAPRAIVKPKQLEDVQTLLQWANKASAKVIPVSSTGTRRRGDTVPQVPDAVICDLSGMRRLIHADKRDKIAIIEPGVDFGSVDALLRPYDLRAFRPLKPRSGKSVLASYLDREPILVPDAQWDTTDPFGGTAMVLGSGDLVKTGGAALEGTLEEQLQRGHRQLYAPGPAHIDLVRVVQGSQGSLGTMVWGAIYCEPIPAAEKSMFASADNLANVMALAKALMHRRICTTLFIVDNVQLAMLMADGPTAFKELVHALPRWTLFVTQAGYQRRPEEKLLWQQRDLHAAAREHDVVLADNLMGCSADDFSASLRTSENAHYQDRFSGAHKELFFLSSMSGLSEIMRAKETQIGATSLGSRSVGTYIQPMVQGTFCHVAFALPCEPQEASPESKLTTDWHGLGRACASAGGFFSRPYADWSQFAFENNSSAKTMMTAAKKLLDPAGVMNPKRLPYAGEA